MKNKDNLDQLTWDFMSEMHDGENKSDVMAFIREIDGIVMSMPQLMPQSQLGLDKARKVGRLLRLVRTEVERLERQIQLWQKLEEPKE